MHRPSQDLDSEKKFGMDEKIFVVGVGRVGSL